jgi:hypothetical protein
MSDIARMLERSVADYDPDPITGLEATLRLVARRDRHRRVVTAVVVLTMFLSAGTAVGVAITGERSTTPASIPSPPGEARANTGQVVPGTAPASGGISLCLAQPQQASGCVRATTAGFGDVVELRAEGHRGLLVGTRLQVWLREPHRPGWRRVDVLDVKRDGGVSWTWEPASSGVERPGRYALQVRIAHQAASSVVEVQFVGES